NFSNLGKLYLQRLYATKPLPDRTKSYKENAVEIYFNEQLESLENITHSKNFLKTLATRIKIKDLFKLIRYFIQYKLK
ncbi:hypothetical protein ACOI3B_05635, partial [Acinetobacter baumannii]